MIEAVPERMVLVMAGGGGTRLWPASTPGRPKQLLSLDPGAGRSLLAATIERTEGLVDRENVRIVAVADQIPGVQAALPKLRTDQIIAEPVGRNTGPCIALSVQYLRAQRGDAVDDATLIVLPADHHVADPDGFRRHLECACAHAEAANAVVTLGIEPNRPETGFGYIERGTTALEAAPGDNGIAAYPGVRFIEKPDQARAQRFVQSGRFLWNAGIFVMPVRRIAEELERHCTETWIALRPVRDELIHRGLDAANAAAATAYDGIEAVPIDIAVMEKLPDLRVVPTSVGWTDLGSWQSVHEVLARDEHGNAAVVGDPQGSAVAIDTRDSLIWTDDARVAVLGLSGVAVIASGGRVLVCALDQAQRVREIVDEADD